VTAREAAGLTQRGLAARLKRPHSFVGRFEAGERRIDVIEFIEIARVLEVDPRQAFREASRLVPRARRQSVRPVVGTAWY